MKKSTIYLNYKKNYLNSLKNENSEVKTIGNSLVTLIHILKNNLLDQEFNSLIHKIFTELPSSFNIFSS